MKSGKAVHPSNGIGTAPDAASSPGGVEVSFDFGSNRQRQSTNLVIVTNLEPSTGNSLEISFANGADGKWFSIPYSTTVRIPAAIHHVRLRGKTGGTAAYSIMGIL